MFLVLLFIRVRKPGEEDEEGASEPGFDERGRDRTEGGQCGSAGENEGEGEDGEVGGDGDRPVLLGEEVQADGGEEGGGEERPAEVEQEEPDRDEVENEAVLAYTQEILSANLQLGRTRQLSWFNNTWSKKDLQRQSLQLTVIPSVNLVSLDNNHNKKVNTFFNSPSQTSA